MSDSVQPHRQEPPGSPIPGIVQARTLEWVAISFPNSVKWKVKVKLLTRIRLLATPWTTTYQAPPSLGFPGKRTEVGHHCLLLRRNNLHQTNDTSLTEKWMFTCHLVISGPSHQDQDDSVFSSGWGLCCLGFLPPVGAPAPTSPLSPPDLPQC